jgi:hypothetical protein
MKARMTLILISIFALALSGCSNTHVSEEKHIELSPASIYKAGYGVQLTETARTFIELQTIEVAVHALAGGAEVTAIPSTALLRTIKGDFVYVENGEWFLRTPVTVGDIDASHIEIKEGLYEGDTIVVKGTRGLYLSEIQILNGGVGCADGH